jgi:hypothetical protein
VFHSIIAGYKASQDFLGLKPRTKADYLKLLPRIEKQFGDLPLAALDDARVTKDFLEWRDGMAASPRQADYSWMVLMRLLSWARARGLTLYRPPGSSAFIMPTAPRFGASRRSPPSWASLPSRCSGRWCWRWKPDSGRATC